MVPHSGQVWSASPEGIRLSVMSKVIESLTKVIVANDMTALRYPEGYLRGSTRLGGERKTTKSTMNEVPEIEVRMLRRCRVWHGVERFWR